jgi:hypothetical protein
VETTIVWDGVTELPAGPFGYARRVPVRLRRGDGSARRLQELQGTFALQVQAPPEPLRTVEPILGAAGRSFPGHHGSAVRVVEVRRGEEGTIHLRLEVTPPPRELLLPGMPARISFVNWGRWWGRGDPPPVPSVGPENLMLLDAVGKKVAVNFGAGRPVNGGFWELTLACPASSDHGPPARLLYSGRRTLSVEVPFTLKDVPLP